MIYWKDKLNSDVVGWLLESDREQPAIKYFTLRDILGYGEDDSEVRVAKSAIMSTGPVPEILGAQDIGGYWMKAGPGYTPKYRSTVWQIIIPKPGHFYGFAVPGSSVSTMTGFLYPTGFLKSQ